jgi:hypothetical protein
VRRVFVFSVLLLMVSAFSGLADAQSGSHTATTTVTADPAITAVGGAVALNATVQPNGVLSLPISRATGTITFLDGSTPMSTVALTPNGFASATFQQTFGTLDPTLVPANPWLGQLTGDLNGDGVPDLLIYNFSPPATSSAQAFLSDGKGGYTTGALQTLSFTGASPSPNPGVSKVPVLVDLNGDGKLDLLDGVEVAYGNGDGSFAQATPVSFLSSGFQTSYAADLNGDGKTDILAIDATLPYPSTSGQIQFAVTVFLNEGGGSFTSAGTFVVDSYPWQFLVYTPTFVDLNGDGILDLVLQWSVVLAGAPQVSVLLNNGNGTFGTPVPLTVPYPPNIGDSSTTYQMGSGDFNGDGKQDLMLALWDDYGNSDAITLLSKGDGTFESPLYFALSTPPNVIVPIIPNFIVQDVNLDGKLDLVFGSGRLALGNGDGTFTLGAPLFPLTNAPYSYPLAQIQLAGNPVPSLVYLLPSATPPPAAVFTPQTSSSAALSLATLAVGTHTVSARYSGDANYAADSSAGLAVTITQAASATAVTSSVNPSFAGQSVTLTAKVTSNGPTHTGNVIFTAGSTTLATVALSGGAAAYTTSFDTAGTQMITASYSGDGNTQASSGVISQVVNAAFAQAPGGSGSTTLTVKAGQTVSAPINVTGTAEFSGQVTFVCSGLPANASCSFSPASITVSGTAAVPTLLSINTAASMTTSQLRLRTIAYGMGLSGLVMLWPIRRRGFPLFAMMICTVAIGALGLTGCSSGGGSSAPPTATAAGTYNFTVTASSGSVQSQSSYTLVVQ